MVWITVLTCLLLLLGSYPVDGQTATYASDTALRTVLQTGYDQKARPYTPTYIDVDYILRSVQKLNVADQTLSHTAFPTLSWHDPRLVWNSSAYSNITKLDIDWIWRPKFFVSNSVDDVDIHGSDNDETTITVFSNGSVLWFVMVVPDTACDANIELFPYDSQACEVYLNFPQYDYTEAIIFNLSISVANTAFYVHNAEWELTSTSVIPFVADVCCPIHSLPFIVVGLNFRRLHTFYLNTFLIPAILLSICLVWPFYVPTESGSRLGFALTILLSYTVLLSITASFLPTTSKQVPNLAVYLLIVLFLCTLSVCNVALNVKIYFLETPVPEPIKTFYRKVMPIVFFKRKSKNKVGTGRSVMTLKDADVEEPQTEKPAIDSNESRANTNDSTDDAVEITWKLVSELFDRICLFIYSFAVVILDIVLMTYLSVKG